MKKSILMLTLLITTTFLYGQKSENEISMTSDQTVDNSDFRRLLSFEGIEIIIKFPILKT